jgi:hypothetical protein
MAGTTGLEPATSAVTGQRSNQLSYVPKQPIQFNRTENADNHQAAKPLAVWANGRADTLSIPQPARRFGMLAWERIS